MTTKIEISVPDSANYEVHVQVRVGGMGGDIDYHFVSPGDTFSFYIYQGKEVISIIEVPLQADTQ